MPSSNVNSNKVTVAVKTSVIKSSVTVNRVTAKALARGLNGTNGTNGVGVPIGGTAGQVLSKIDATNYNTQWVNQSGGGSGTVTSVNASGANGVSVSGGPITSSGSLTIGLGAITPSSVVSSGTVTGTNLSGTNTGDQTITLTGDVTGSGTSSFVTAIGTGVIVNADVNASAGISLSKLAATTVNRALVSDGSGFISPSATTSTEVGYLSGVTSAIQTQLNAKQNSLTLTTTGTSGASTLIGSVLNIPQYSGGGGGSGDVVGPAGSSANTFATFNGTTGKLIQQAAGMTYASGNLDFNVAGNQAITNLLTINTYTIPNSNIVGISSTQTLTNKDLTSGTNTFPTFNQSTTGSAATLTTARTIGTLTGDVTSAGSTFNGSANNTNATVLATVNSNVGSFGTATQVATFSVNAKGLTTAAGNTSIQIAESQVTNLVTDLAAKQDNLTLTTVGTSGAASLIGATLNIPNYAGGGGSAGITRSVSNISGTTSAGSTALVDYVYICTGTFTLTLPTAVSNTNLYTVKNSGSGTITVATTSSQTIDGNASMLVGPGSSRDLVSNNTNWVNT